MIGEAPPSSLVIGLSSSGVPARLRLAASAPVPQTIASWLTMLPVMCTCATRSWWARKPPTAAPPCTIRSSPASISGANAAAYGSARSASTGLSLRIEARLSATSP